MTAAVTAAATANARCVMRAGDRTQPAVAAHPMPDRPLRPVIALEPRTIQYVWDDAALAYDSGYAWDTNVAPSSWVDMWCDFQGLTIETGHPDDDGLFDTGRVVLQVDNRSGRWSQYNADGSLVEFGPGRHLAIWATDGSSSWWLFYGRVSR